MNCPKCGSDNVNVATTTHVESRRRSFLWNLCMCFVTCGFWLLWMAVRKRKEKVVTETFATCQSCGKHWKIS